MVKKLLDKHRSCKRQNNFFRIQKANKKKGDKLFVKWRAYDNSFKCWINARAILQKWFNIFLINPFSCFGGNVKVELTK